MHKLITRTATSIVLMCISVTVYQLLPPIILSVLLVTIAFYVLWFEYRPLFMPDKYASYSNLIMIVAGFAYLVYLNQSPIFRDLMVLSFISATCADTGSYIAGNLFGKHLLAPRISPKKTWEGFIGGCIAASFGVAAWSYFFRNFDISWHYPLPLFIFIFLGFFVALFALVGDLNVSLLKRNAGVKEPARYFPDMVDCLID